MRCLYGLFSNVKTKVEEHRLHKDKGSNVFVKLGEFDAHYQNIVQLTMYLSSTLHPIVQGFF